MEEARRRGHHGTEEDIFKEDGSRGALGIDERPVLYQLSRSLGCGSRLAGSRAELAANSLPSRNTGVKKRIGYLRILQAGNSRAWKPGHAVEIF